MSQLAWEDKRIVLFQAGWCHYPTRSWAGCLASSTFTVCQSLPAFHLGSNFYPFPHFRNYFRSSLGEVTIISPALLRLFVLSVKDQRWGWEQALN